MINVVEVIADCYSDTSNFLIELLEKIKLNLNIIIILFQLCMYTLSFVLHCVAVNRIIFAFCCRLIRQLILVIYNH